MKKLTTFLLIFTLLLGLCAPVRAFEDTDGIPEEDAIDLLYALGIVDGKTNKIFDPAGSLTRAEATVIVARLLNGEGSGSGNLPFTDVEAGHWAFPGISFSYDMEIINGMTPDTFCPDETLTYEQAVKMLVVALGYKVKAEAAGGYPGGYMMVANTLGLLKGVESNTGHFTRAAMTKLAQNALDAVPFVRTTYGDDAGEYKELTGETMASHYLKLKKVTGVVAANYMDTVIKGVPDADADEIVVNNTIFKEGKTKAGSFIGQKVNLYASEDNGIFTILHIEADSRSNAVTVQGKDIIASSTTADRVYYEDKEGQKHSLSIKSAPTFVKNGIPSAFNEAALESGYGEYTFIFNDTSSADVILYNAYENYTVKSIDKNDFIVYFKEGGSETFDKTNNSVKLSFTKADGENAGVEDCKEWDIVSVARSADGSVIKAILSNERVTGVISEQNKNSFVIDGKEYDFARNVNSANLPKPGDKVTVSLDYAGNAAAFNDDVLTENYAFLVAAQATEGLNAKMQIKIFTTEGEMIAKTLEEKIYFNDKADKIDALKLLDQTELFRLGDFRRQLITFEENGEGNITRIRTAAKGSDYSWEDKLSVFSLDFEISASAGSTSGRFIGGESNTFAGRYRSAGKTILFTVPQDSQADEDTMYKVTSNQPFIHNSEYKNIKLYDVDKDNIISVAVQTETVSTAVSANSVNFGVVEGCGTILDEDGNAVDSMIVWNGESDVNLVLKDDLVITTDSNIIRNNGDPKKSVQRLLATELDKGDVVQYETDSVGQVTAMSVRFRAKYPVVIEKAIHNNAAATPGEDYNYYQLQYLYGTAAHVVTDGIVVEVPASEGGNLNERLYPFVNTKAIVVLCDSANNEIENITLSDIQDGDKVFVARVLTETVLVCVYR